MVGGPAFRLLDVATLITDNWHEAEWGSVPEVEYGGRIAIHLWAYKKKTKRNLNNELVQVTEYANYTYTKQRFI